MTPVMRTPPSLRMRSPPSRPTEAVVAELRSGLRRATDDLARFERRPHAGAAQAFARQLEGLRRSARDLLTPEGRDHG